jgi:ABC-type multidrug transport system fused ATPase/permease subunit
VDDHDITTLNLTWLRSIIGFVQQEPILFGSTIAQNIAYGVHDRSVSFDEIQHAAQQANVHDDILRFPQVTIVELRNLF